MVARVSSLALGRLFSSSWPALVIVTALAAVVACAGGPSPERARCLDECSRAKDGCMLDAADARQVQGCDETSRACNELCVP